MADESNPLRITDAEIEDFILPTEEEAAEMGPCVGLALAIGLALVRAEALVASGDATRADVASAFTTAAECVAGGGGMADRVRKALDN